MMKDSRTLVAIPLRYTYNVEAHNRAAIGVIIMNGPVLVPLDGSQLAEQALPFALSLARHYTLPILLARIVPMPAQPVPLVSGDTLTVDEQLDILRDDASTYLRDCAAELEEEDVTVSSQVSVGVAGEAIADVAEREEAACIVMATHGRTGLSRWALGSVADRVLHLTRRPLLLTRPREVHELSFSDLPEFQRILVPLDGSPLAEQALSYASDIAHVYGAALRLLRVMTLPAAGLAGLEAGVVEAAYWETAREEAENYLARVATDLESEGIDVEYAVGTEPVADNILSFARGNTVDLIVMTTHAREGVRRILLGSVTDRVVRAGAVPVLVTRPTEE